MRSRIIAYTLFVFAAVALPALAVPHPQSQQRNNQAHASAPSPNLQETTGISHIEGMTSVHPEQAGSTLRSSTHRTTHVAQSRRKVALLEQLETESSLGPPTVHEPLRSTNSRDAQSRKPKLTTPHHSLHSSSRTLLPEVQEQSERNLRANHVAANSRTPTVHKNSLQRPTTTNFYSTDRRASHLRHKVMHHKHSQLHAIDDESGTSGSRWHPTNKVAHLEQPERTSLLRQSLRPFNQKVSYIKLGNNEDAVRGSSSSFTRIPNASSHKNVRSNVSHKTLLYVKTDFNEKPNDPSSKINQCYVTFYSHHPEEIGRRDVYSNIYIRSPWRGGFPHRPIVGKREEESFVLARSSSVDLMARDPNIFTNVIKNVVKKILKRDIDVEDIVVRDLAHRELFGSELVARDYHEIDDLIAREPNIITNLVKNVVKKILKREGEEGLVE